MSNPIKGRPGLKLVKMSKSVAFGGLFLACWKRQIQQSVFPFCFVPKNKLHLLLLFDSTIKQNLIKCMEMCMASRTYYKIKLLNQTHLGKLAIELYTEWSVNCSKLPTVNNQWSNNTESSTNEIQNQCGLQTKNNLAPNFLLSIHKLRIQTTFITKSYPSKTFCGTEYCEEKKISP